MKLCYSEAASVDFYLFFCLLCENGKSANVGKIEHDCIISQLPRAFYSTSNQDSVNPLFIIPYFRTLSVLSTTHDYLISHSHHPTTVVPH